jgi:hypothetical protein
MQFRSTSLWTILLVAAPALGFNPVAPRRASTVALGLTSDEALARARASHGVASDDEEPAPKIFEDELLADMQQALLALELRVKQGPGSLSALEVEELDGQLQRIMNDMRVNQHKKPLKPERTAEAPAAPQQAGAAPAKSQVVTDTNFNDEEGQMYNGEGGMGLSRGTANTYMLEGMDDMSPEEYREKLQQSVIDRQQRRKDTGEYGNRQSWSYISSLTGEIEGPLKRDESSGIKERWDKKKKK